MIITPEEQVRKSMEIINLDFLNKLSEVVRLLQPPERSEVNNYVEKLHRAFGFEVPDLTPYVITTQHYGPGKLVIYNNCQRGRTYNNLGIINGKVPVFPEINDGHSSTGILVDPAKLNIYGYID